MTSKCTAAARKELCKDLDCKKCLKKSFASRPQSKN